MNYLDFFDKSQIKKYAFGGNATKDAVEWKLKLAQMEAESEADELNRYNNAFADETAAINANPTMAALNTANTGNPLGKTKNPSSANSKFNLSKALNIFSALNNTNGTDANDAMNGVMSAVANSNPAAGVGAVFNAGIDIADKATMGNKNFDTASQATDQLVNGTINALMASGDPATIGVAMAIKGANFIDKAAGKTVTGFETNIDSSGFGGINSSMGDSSYRGTQTRRMERMFGRRNQQAEMALAASGLSKDFSFQQEARLNSIQNTMLNNQIALSGGLQTDLLAAKRGAKLQKLNNYKEIIAQRKAAKAQNGAKLKHIEVSSEPNVIPEGDYHKNKHDLDLENITKKGIPVIQVPDDSVDTYTEIKQQEGDIVQSAEIERNEITMNLELTQFIEEKRKAWHEDNEKNDDILLEVGLRFVKELMTNTNDNTNLIAKMQEKLDNEKNSN